jgi:hypothetical protein
MRARLLCILGVSLSSATAVARQPAPPLALPVALRAHLQSGRFDIVSSIRGLPLGIRDELQKLFGSQTLDIAESGAPFQGSGRTAESLPMRRLVAAACSYADCLVYYELGGRAGRTWRVLLLHWTPNATKFEWGATAPGTLTTIDEVRRAVLSGTIKGSSGPW